MYEFLEYTVADVMTRSPVTIEGQRPLEEAAAIFAQHDFNALPVVDAAGRMRGLLTKLDFLRAFVFTPESMVPRYSEILERPVDSVMTRDPETLRPEEPLTRVLQRMVDERRKSFPVEEGGRLVGMLAREDLMRALRRADEAAGD
jgi:CBS-domain-containing membrane protein